MIGLKVISDREPLDHIPDDWTGLRIAIKKTGGVGDVVIALASTARKLKERDCHVTVAVREHQIPLMQSFAHIDNVIQVQSLNNPVMRQRYDALVNFNGLFAERRKLKACEYYGLVEERLGMSVPLGELRAETVTPGGIFLHAGASNPNRRWFDYKWEELAYSLAERGFQVWFLGTRSDYGFSCGESIVRLADIDESIRYQTYCLMGASYFIGNDSGFAHIAGVAGIEGAVIFSATHPKDVIARYPTLTSIDCFERLNVEPTRSLTPEDETSFRCLGEISVEDVLQKTEFYKQPTIRTVTGKPLQTKLPVQWIAPNLEWATKCHEYLETFYNIYSDECNISLRWDGNIRSKTLILRVGIREVFVQCSHPENVRRAILELTNG